MKHTTLSQFALGLALLLFAACTSSTLQAQQPASKPAPDTAAPARPEPKPAPKPEPKIEATPALWMVKGPHTTLYLFGTVHIMKPNVSWHTPKVTAAVDASSVLLEELSDADKAESMPSEETKTLIQQLGTDPQHPLSSKITKEDLAILDNAMKQMGAPGEAPLEQLRPWLAGLTIQVLPLIKSGFDAKSGVDIILAGQFRDKNKPVQGFETISEQLHMLADLPQDEEVASLHIELQGLDHATADLQKIMTAWQKGDAETIASIENDSFAKDNPALYQRLVVERNRRWADKLAQMLQSQDPDSTTFVAVGAAHLAGPDSIQKMLEAKGFKVVQQ